MSALTALIAAGNGKPPAPLNSGPSVSGSPADFAQILRERSPLPAERMPTPLPALPDAPPAPPLINPPRQAAPTPLPPSRDEAPREQDPPRQEAAPDGAEGRAADAQKLKHAQQERQQLERQTRNRLEQNAIEKRKAQTASADAEAGPAAADASAEVGKDEAPLENPDPAGMAQAQPTDSRPTAPAPSAEPQRANGALQLELPPGSDRPSATENPAAGDATRANAAQVGPHLAMQDRKADASADASATTSDRPGTGDPKVEAGQGAQRSATLNKALTGELESSTQAAAGRSGALPLPRASVDAAQPAAGDTRALQSLGAQPSAATPAESSSSPNTPLGAGSASAFAQALQQLGAPQASGSAASSAPAEPGAASRLDLPTPLHDPRFGPELGARLSLLASEGVQQARLHLNPAEMGPVSVQIQLDGQQAQISFQAEQAQTREVLERSLPELAAALRENGLTLSGGGVFQQAQQQGQAQGDAAASSSHGTPRTQAGTEAEPGEPAGAPRAMARRSQGVLDLYA